MQVMGNGNDGHIINNVLVNVGAPTVSGILEILYCKVVSLQLIVRSFTGAFTGNWLVEGSNNFSPVAGGTNYGQPTNAGDWTDITAIFVNTAITAAITANGTQLVHAPAPGLGCRHIRVTITRTGGTSIIGDVWACGKGS